MFFDVFQAYQNLISCFIHPYFHLKPASQIRFYLFFIANFLSLYPNFGCCYLSSFLQRCLEVSLVLLPSTCTFNMVAAFCIGVHSVLVTRCLSAKGGRHDKFEVVPRTIVSVEYEMEKEASRAVEYPPIKDKPSRRRVIVNHKISRVEDTVSGTIQKNNFSKY